MSLKPCNHCKSTVLAVWNDGNKEGPSYWVACHTCFARGPMRGSEMEATQAWNIRPGDEPITPAALKDRGFEETNLGDSFRRYTGRVSILFEDKKWFVKVWMGAISAQVIIHGPKNIGELDAILRMLGIEKGGAQ